MVINKQLLNIIIPSLIDIVLVMLLSLFIFVFSNQPQIFPKSAISVSHAIKTVKIPSSQIDPLLSDLQYHDLLLLIVKHDLPIPFSSDLIFQHIILVTDFPFDTFGPRMQIKHSPFMSVVVILYLSMEIYRNISIDDIIDCNLRFIKRHQIILFQQMDSLSIGQINLTLFAPIKYLNPHISINFARLVFIMIPDPVMIYHLADIVFIIKRFSFLAP